MLQIDLAEGICSVEQISRIENNKVSPSITIVSKLSIRLGVELNKYIPYINLKNAYEVKNLLDDLNYLSLTQNYGKLAELLDENKSLFNTDNATLKQELMLLKDVSKYYEAENNIYKKERAINLM